MIVETAPAKINLALHVRRRRADGYHEIETLFAFASHGDTVSLDRAAADSFTVTGPFADDLRPQPGQGSDGNLVTRAAAAFAAAFGISDRHAIVLNKHLPIASGIGGGSADAAATLRGFGRLHDVDRADPRLIEIAASLGADVPACLLGRTAFGTGRGDLLTPLDGVAGTPLLLVNPGVAVSTAAVFASWDGIDRGPIPDGDLFARAAAARNDLEPPALRIAPEIAKVLARLNAATGVRLARMSGSGATCLALFGTEADRAAAARDAAATDYWHLETTIA
ncbi:4-(cytidine 5'-diphospho)-2-C-methyl-D-erythritol kinase [Sphingomonas sp. Tas61C01]|uniref:4-(cytidine 5'-diphospho)-2-C-methyl-D-erythritol kinase n=1 Tax=Sphingomonas sp. Tas61C01 TaxID=3458297 RepID=UPI00403EBEB2